jgi:hypothetical protein
MRRATRAVCRLRRDPLAVNNNRRLTRAVKKCSVHATAALGVTSVAVFLLGVYVRYWCRRFFSLGQNSRWRLLFDLLRVAVILVIATKIFAILAGTALWAFFKLIGYDG